MRGIRNEVYICTVSRQRDGCDIYITKTTGDVDDGDDEGVNRPGDFRNRKGLVCLLDGLFFCAYILPYSSLKTTQRLMRVLPTNSARGGSSIGEQKCFLMGI